MCYFGRSQLNIPRTTNDETIPVLRDALGRLLTGDYHAAESTLEKLRCELPPSLRRATIAPEAQLRVFVRDGFACRYCGLEVVFVPVLRLLSARFPGALPHDPHWKMSQCHMVYWRHGASCDHIVPVARGGSSCEDNLVTSCYMCNSMKQNWLLEELRWQAFSPATSDWDGFVGIYPRLCEVIEAGTESYHRRWLMAVKNVWGMDK